jgi:hypothetical protein
MKHKWRSLNLLRNQDDFLIVQCDICLWPAIIQKDGYINLVLLHLQDITTCCRLIPLEATMYSGNIQQTFQSWVSRHKKSLTKNKVQYLQLSLASNVDYFSDFYLLMKVH